MNPYAPPEIGDTRPNATPADPASLAELVKAWEKLRLLYNGILLIPGLGVMIVWISQVPMPPAFPVILSVMVAIGANMAFFLGPLSELYIRALFHKGMPLGKGRMLIFGAGLAVSAGVFLLAAVIPLLNS